MREDKTQEIIRLQQEIISQMTEQRRRSLLSDLWGDETPALDEGKEPEKNIKGIERNVDKNTDKKAENKAELRAEEKQAEAEEKSFDELLEELNGLIGLENIKTEVRELMSLARIDSMRREKGLPTTDISLHMVFKGNPGTGKTMVARLISKMLKSLNVISKGQLIETDRAGLVAGFVGQTAQKTSEVVERAKGGVLFIDEAYTLSYKSENDYGREAIDTLLKLMEDFRRDLVVIVAGYDELMDGFIASNPGLKSRFNRFFSFEDYSDEELVKIFKLNIKKAGFLMGEGLEDALLERLKSIDKASFGNARGIRNLLENALVRQAVRLSALAEKAQPAASPVTVSQTAEKDISLDEKSLLTIEKEDILFGEGLNGETGESADKNTEKGEKEGEKTPIKGHNAGELKYVD